VYLAQVSLHFPKYATSKTLPGVVLSAIVELIREDKESFFKFQMEQRAKAALGKMKF
jgi:hypothetical protein